MRISKINYEIIQRIDKVTYKKEQNNNKNNKERKNKAFEEELEKQKQLRKEKK